MSFPPGLFYVHIADQINVNSSAVSSRRMTRSHDKRPLQLESSKPRALVAFISRTRADEYWRTLQERFHSSSQNPSSPSSTSLSRLARMSPQYIVGRPPSWKFGVVQRPTSGEALLVPPSLGDSRPDNINGGSFYIRSAVKPDLFWFYNPANRTIEGSSKMRTKFTIQRVVPLPFECLPEEDILIGRDDVRISFFHEHHDQGSELEEIVVKGDWNKLVLASIIGDGASGEAGVFKFSLFDGGFQCMKEGSQVTVSSRSNGGDRWEFVN